jgi:hypothetical protein
MTKFKNSLYSLLIILPLLAGCSTTSVISPAVVQQGVATGVSYGVLKYPQAVPELRIASEVICSAANSTNLSPAVVVSAVQAADPNLTPETTLIINGALVLYIGIWDSYGAKALDNQPDIPSVIRQVRVREVIVGHPKMSRVPPGRSPRITHTKQLLGLIVTDTAHGMTSKLTFIRLRHRHNPAGSHVR